LDHFFTPSIQLTGKRERAIPEGLLSPIANSDKSRDEESPIVYFDEQGQLQIKRQRDCGDSDPSEFSTKAL